jgi:hypothetical protein
MFLSVYQSNRSGEQQKQRVYKMGSEQVGKQSQSEQPAEQAAASSVWRLSRAERGDSPADGDGVWPSVSALNISALEISAMSNSISAQHRSCSAQLLEISALSCSAQWALNLALNLKTKQRGGAARL